MSHDTQVLSQNLQKSPPKLSQDQSQDQVQEVPSQVHNHKPTPTFIWKSSQVKSKDQTQDQQVLSRVKVKTKSQIKIESQAAHIFYKLKSESIPYDSNWYLIQSQAQFLIHD